MMESEDNVGGNSADMKQAHVPKVSCYDTYHGANIYTIYVRIMIFTPDAELHFNTNSQPQTMILQEITLLASRK